MAYIGYQPPDNFNSGRLKEDFVGNNTTGPFILSKEATGGFATSVEVFVNTVRQEPLSSYNIGGVGSNLNKELTFTVAPATSADIYVIHKGDITNLIAVGDGTIDAVKLANNAVTPEKTSFFKTTTDPSAVFEVIDSTSKGTSLVPKMTETQRDAISSPITALIIYNTTASKLNIYNGSQWEELGGSGGADSVLSITNAADIFTNFVKDMEDHGRTSLHTEAGFIDELEASDDMIDESNSAGFVYDATDDFYGNTTTQSDSVPFTTESNYIQQEWTNSNQSTSQATVSGTTVTLSSGSWPTNCDKGRISFNSGSTFHDIFSRDSNTQLTILLPPTAGTFDYIIRSSEFDAGVVKLNQIVFDAFSSDITSGETFTTDCPINTGVIGDSFDNNASTSTDFFTTASPNTLLPRHIGVQFGSAKEIGKITINCNGSEGRARQVTFKVQGSNDGTNYTDIHTETNYDFATTSSQLDTFTFSNSTSYIHYRIRWENSTHTSQDSANNGGFPTMYEIEMMENIQLTPININEYVSVLTKESFNANVSNWSSIVSSSITETSDSNSDIYYYLGFNPTAGYGAGTEVKIFHQGDSVWRTIAKNNAGTWEYNSSTTGSAATFTGTATTLNDITHAISQAISLNSTNRMTRAQMEAISSAEFNSVNGFDKTSHTTLFRGVTLYAVSGTTGASVDSYNISHTVSGPFDLRTKQWTGTNGTPAAPASAPDTIYLFVVDEVVTGNATFAVTRDGGTTYTNLTFDKDWVFSGTKRARRATVDISSQPSGTDPRVKVTYPINDIYKIHAIGLQTK